MSDFPVFSRMPGSGASDDFDPSEIAGMRTAGWILVSTAAISLLGALLGGVGASAISIVVDAVLGVQLLRLRHSWRAWVLARAGIGVVLGAVMSARGLLAGPAPVGAGVVGLGQIVYCASLFLLLLGMPTTRRVVVGRLAFALSVVLLLAGGFLVARQPLPVQDAVVLRPPVRLARINGTVVPLAGPTSSQLGAEDFKQIDEAISAARPWLVIADWPERHRPDDLPVTVFFEADITTPDLRKGNATIVSGVPVSANGSRPPRKWEAFPVAMRYAQVATADGTSWQMTDDGDLVRPFTIGEVRAAGQLADRDIVSLVRFIRESQAVNGAWPIHDMTLIAPSTVRVILLDVDAARRSGQEAICRFEDGGWVVAAVGLWAI